MLLTTRVDDQLAQTFDAFLEASHTHRRAEIETAIAVHIARRCIAHPGLYRGTTSALGIALAGLPAVDCLTPVADELRGIVTADGFIERHPRLAAFIDAAIHEAQWGAMEAPDVAFGLDAEAWSGDDIACALQGLWTIKAQMIKRLGWSAAADIESGVTSGWPEYLSGIEKALRAEAERRQSGE